MSTAVPALSPAGPRRAPRWSVAGCRRRMAAGVDGRAAGQQGHGLGRPAVIAQAVPAAGRAAAAMVPVRSEPTQPELPSVSPIRLLPWEAKVPKASGPLVVAVFSATMVLVSVAVLPPLLYRPPPLPGGVAADGAVGQRGRAAAAVVQAAAVGWRSCR